jgi:SulP family sulfate permease
MFLSKSGPSRPIWLSRVFPALVWSSRVNRESLRADLIAGITGAVVVLPQGVAFATIAGMPPEYGLYAGMVPAIVAALYGSSWHLVSGPTTAASVVLLSTLSSFAPPGSAAYISLALTLTFMVGCIQLALGLARFGALVNFISHSVLVGFTAGAALLIASKQLGNLTGVSLPSEGHAYEAVIALIGQLPGVNGYVLVVSGSTLLLGIVLKVGFPRAPYLMIAMFGGSLVAALLNGIYGNGVTGIETFGALPASLPPISSPYFSLQTIRDLAPATLAITLFALTEAVTIGRSIASKSGQHINGNQEFIGQGLSNIAGSFFSGYVATGSFNRSAMNFQAGARTPLAAVFAGVLLMLVVLLVAPLAVYLPKGAMAGILLLVAWRLIDLVEIAHIVRGSRSETAILATTFFGTMFLDLEFAIFLGVLLSLVVYLNRTSKPKIHTRVPNRYDPLRKFVTDPGLPECPQLKIIRIDGSLYFGAVPHVVEALRRFEERQPGQKSLFVIARSINFVDMEGAGLLINEARKRRGVGGDLYLFGIKEGVRESLERWGHIETIGEENISESKTELIGKAFRDLDKDICRRCDKRIFRECTGAPGPDDPP